jgi:hypothetical protein
MPSGHPSVLLARGGTAYTQHFKALQIQDESDLATSTDRSGHMAISDHI